MSVEAKMSVNATSLAERLARPELLTLEPYQSARRIGGEGQIWINANESPFINSDLDSLNRYPECQPPELITRYAEYAGVSNQQVLTSRGADEAIELLIRTFCIPGRDSIACFGPTYGMYAISAKTFNVGVKALRLDDEYQLPQELCSQVGDAKLVFICNPNNPTGTVIAPDAIEAVIRSLPDTLVVVDEAYIEFCPDYSVASLLDKYDNLIVLRTLSKAFALAGARCGFMLATPEVIEMVMRVIAPYPVPLPVAKLAIDALSKDGIARMQTQVAQLKANGQRLADALREAGARVLPAYGNFVLAYFDQANEIKVGEMQARLKQTGVVARAYKDPALADAIRFSFASDAQTETLIAILKAD
ncbi:histidinol-phosphate transaminase [Shewanella loihica]|uniref:Histidinol-phosphate aminotransferase n=1 Tax=Shewanella loihica (strain ATCC BAA-1088 / PV-4) TaxID=323850 RepID=A3QF17_SHELP|nr:histidinol-phosphate transaminase [Shewanella loihica]ABO24065.1 histidinol phosphate aminotransferase [Shewanella loihica PV-4]